MLSEELLELANKIVNLKAETQTIEIKAAHQGCPKRLYDTGLLMARYGMQTKLALMNNTLKGNVKGGIYENLVSEMLVKNGYTLHYYKTSNSSMELEFIIEKNGEVIPVEVKAGNTSTASLNMFISNFKPSVAYKIANTNIGNTNDRITIPHYMAMFI